MYLDELETEMMHSNLLIECEFCVVAMDIQQSSRYLQRAFIGNSPVHLW